MIKEIAKYFNIKGVYTGDGVFFLEKPLGSNSWNGNVTERWDPVNNDFDFNYLISNMRGVNLNVRIDTLSINVEVSNDNFYVSGKYIKSKEDYNLKLYRTCVLKTIHAFCIVNE